MDIAIDKLIDITYMCELILDIFDVKDLTLTNNLCCKRNTTN